jgi:hypothetical protein
MSASLPDGPPPPYRPPNSPPNNPPLPEMDRIELACTLACGFYSLLATLSKNRMSKDGTTEALAMADCMLSCQDKYGKKKSTKN